MNELKIKLQLCMQVTILGCLCGNLFT